MDQAHPKPIWHLSRRDERPCALSNQELLLLAELGHLRAEDLLWRPDFDGWRTVRSLLGHVTAAPLPSSISLSERPKQIGSKATLLLSRYQKKSGSPGLIESTAASRRLHGIATLIRNRLTGHVARWGGEFPLLAKDCLGSIQLNGRGANRHIKRVEFDLEEFLGRLEHPRNLAGLLVAVVLVGVLGIAMHKSFATDTQPALQYSVSTEPRSAAIELYAASTEPHSASTEPQQPKSEPATATAVTPSQSTGQAELEGGIIVRTVRVFSIDNLQPSDASVLVPDPVSEAPSTSVPLPTKKPAKPVKSLSIAEGERARTAAPKRMSQAPVPKPMRFGSIGFNYSDPAQ
jgi:hypothetical protein